jgi:uncharacterized delta-60 repeat protein
VSYADGTSVWNVYCYILLDFEATGLLMKIVVSAFFRFISYLFSAALTFSASFAADSITLSPPVLSLTPEPSRQVLVLHSNSITRLNPDLTIDSAFPRGGFVQSIAIENDGMILLKSPTSFRRINTDGVQQSTFQVSFRSFLLQPDGKVIGLRPNALSRLNPDGTADQTFTPASFSSASSSVVGIQEDGKLLLASTFDGSVLRFHPDGSIDTGFNAPKIALPWVNSILVQPDGKILIGGQFQTVGQENRNGLVRLNADGSLDFQFNPATETQTIIQSIALQANGKIIVSGLFETLGGQAATNIARLYPDGALDTTFPVGSVDLAAQSSPPFALLEDGSVLAGFYDKVVRLQNSEVPSQSFTHSSNTLTWLRGGSAPEVYHTRFQASLDGIVWTDLGTGHRIPGGWELQAASVPLNARFRLRGYISGTSHYLDFVPGSPAILVEPRDQTNNVNTTATFRVIAKGREPLSFQWFKDGIVVPDALTSSLVLSNVTGADTDTYWVVVNNSEGSSTSRVAQLSVIDPVIFTHPVSAAVNVGETHTFSIDAAGTGLTFQWRKDGQVITGATSSTLIISNASPTHTGEYQVVLTGTYGSLESEVANLLVNSALPDPAWRLNYEASSQSFPIQTAIAFNNEVYIGGSFRTLEVPFRQNLVKFNANGSIDPTFAPEPTGGEVGGVTGLALAPNGQLLVGGNFLRIDGKSQPYLARLDPDGTLDEQFRPVIEGLMGGIYTQVVAIEILPDARILIAGGFSSVNGQPRPGIARLFPDGRLDESFNPDVSSVPETSWGLFVQSDGKIIASGWDLRRLNSNGTLDSEFTESITADSFNVVPLANEQMLVTSQASLQPTMITLLNADGTVDSSYKGPTAGAVASVQADGKFLVAESFLEDGVYFRYDLQGTKDPAFSPLFDNFATIPTMRADGSFLAVGPFNHVSTKPFSKFALIRNTEPASTSLTFNGSTARWFRSRTSPEVTRTSFEFSADGQTWTNLGSGVRINGGWELGGLNITSPGRLRARGFVGGNIYDQTIEFPQQLTLDAPTYLATTGEMRVSANAPAGAYAILQSSIDLRQWNSIQTNLVGNQPLQVVLTNGPSPFLFYRLRLDE